MQTLRIIPKTPLLNNCNLHTIYYVFRSPRTPRVILQPDVATVFVNGDYVLKVVAIGLPNVPSEVKGRTAKVSVLPGGSSDLGMSSVVTPPFYRQHVVINAHDIPLPTIPDEFILFNGYFQNSLAVRKTSFAMRMAWRDLNKRSQPVRAINLAPVRRAVVPMPEKPQRIAISAERHARFTSKNPVRQDEKRLCSFIGCIWGNMFLHKINQTSLVCAPMPPEEMCS